MKSLGWVLIQYDYVLMKRGNLDTKREIGREHHVKVRVRLLEDKEC